MPKIVKKTNERKRRRKKNILHILSCDLRKHATYTFFIALLSIATYTVVGFAIHNPISHLFSFYKAEGKITSVNEKNTYSENGSPFDKDINKNSSQQVIFNGDRNTKKIALTFDAEMTEGMKENLISGRVKTSYNNKIIDILNQNNTKATLFLTGMWIELYPKETEELSKNPLFELGSHSYTDSSYNGYCFGLTQLHSAIKIEEIGATEKLLREHAHIDNFLFRFPGGCYTPDDVKLVNQAGDMVVHWDVVGDDGFNENTQQIIKNVVDRTQNGSIIVLHLNGAPTAPKTADALPEIISELKKKGFEFVKVNELLNLPPETQSF